MHGMPISQAVESAKSAADFEEEDTVRDALKGIIKMSRNRRLDEILTDDEKPEKPAPKRRVDDIISKVVKKASGHNPGNHNSKKQKSYY